MSDHPNDGQGMQLGPQEAERLNELEALIDKKLKSFLEVGAALLEIREGKLYRRDYPTFDTYCAERWGFTSARARQLMLATKTSEALGFDLPSEAVARALQSYPEPLRETILLIAQGQANFLNREINSGMIKRVGDVLTQAVVTGAISPDGEASAFDATLTEEAYEAMERQRTHIKESMNVKVAPIWKGQAHIITSADLGGVIELDATPGTLDLFPAQFSITIWPIIEDENDA